jgi:predicted transcriptional regulator
MRSNYQVSYLILQRIRAALQEQPQTARQLRERLNLSRRTVYSALDTLTRAKQVQYNRTQPIWNQKPVKTYSIGAQPQMTNKAELITKEYALLVETANTMWQEHKAFLHANLAAEWSQEIEAIKLEAIHLLPDNGGISRMVVTYPDRLYEHLAKPENAVLSLLGGVLLADEQPSASLERV